MGGGKVAWLLKISPKVTWGDEVVLEQLQHDKSIGIRKNGGWLTQWNLLGDLVRLGALVECSRLVKGSHYSIFKEPHAAHSFTTQKWVTYKKVLQESIKNWPRYGIFKILIFLVKTRKTTLPRHFQPKACWSKELWDGVKSRFNSINLDLKLDKSDFMLTLICPNDEHEQDRYNI